MHNLKCPNIEDYKNYKCPFIPLYGLIIIPDPFEQINEDLKLITDLKASTEFTTSNDSVISGIVVAISEDFHEDEIGYHKINLGDRILAPANKATLLVDPNIHKQLAQFRETDIEAIIPTDLKLTID